VSVEGVVVELGVVEEVVVEFGVVEEPAEFDVVGDELAAVAGEAVSGLGGPSITSRKDM
jgi:hypothetical protein